MGIPGMIRHVTRSFGINFNSLLHHKIVPIGIQYIFKITNIIALKLCKYFMNYHEVNWFENSNYFLGIYNP